MTTKKNKPNFTLRVIKNGKTIDKCQTHSKRDLLFALSAFAEDI